MSAPKLTRDGELLRTARAVVALQRKIAKWRRQIKAAQLELRHERKMLRGLAYAAENRPDVAPSRLTGGATGLPLPARAPATWTPKERAAALDLATAPGLEAETAATLEAIGVAEPTPDAGIAKADRAFQRSRKVED